jgi:Gas vesicle protein G
MGLISEILLLPLAPIRGTVWLAEKLQEQAEGELYDEKRIYEQLSELEALRESGELSDEEASRAEDLLLERLIAARAVEDEKHG